MISVNWYINPYKMTLFLFYVVEHIKKLVGVKNKQYFCGDLYYADFGLL